MIKKVAIGMLVVGFAAAALAHTFAFVQKTCPLCDTNFETREDMSGTSFGMRLDLKPIGPIAAPWSVPVCPQCKFVLYDDDIPKEELETCSAIVASPEYVKHRDRASYYLLGLLYEGLKRENLKTAHVFLKASWQEECNETHLKEVLELSLKHFDAYLRRVLQEQGKQNTEHDESKDQSPAYNTARLLKGEILRRLERFEEAKAHLQSLKAANELQDDFLRDIVRYQIKLCEQMDARPHDISEVMRTETSESTQPD